MQSNGLNRTGPHSFTLIEMVGVLAVLALLAALLLPRTFEAIHHGLIDHAAVTLGTVKTACVGHVAKFGAVAVDGSVTPQETISLGGSDPRSSQFDGVLLLEAFLDKPFAVKIGDGILDATHTRVQIVPAVGATTEADGVNAAYDLDGSGTSNDASGTVVVEAVITAVTLEDARALNEIIDGPALGENPSGNDFRGRVKYGKPANNNGIGNGNGKGNGIEGNNGNGNGYGNSHAANTVDVHVYLAHR